MDSFVLVITNIFDWLTKTTLHASVIVLIVIGVRYLLSKRLAPRWHYYLWLLVIARMLMPIAPQSAFSIFNLIPAATEQTTPTEPEPVVAQVPQATPEAVAIETNFAPQPPIETIAVTEQAPAAPVPIEQIAAAPDPAQPEPIDYIALLPLVWLAGVFALAAYVLLGNIRLSRIVTQQRPVTDSGVLNLLEDCKSQMNMHTYLTVVETSKVSSPALFGFIRPRLLLPEGLLEKLTPAQLRHVFLHELAHLKRGDIYFGWLVALLQTIHWFNPLVWLAFHKMRADRELACDQLALTSIQNEEPNEYGKTIVSLLENFSTPSYNPGLAGILEDRSQLKRRITMIAKHKKGSYRFSTLAAIVIAILCAVALTSAKDTTTLEEKKASANTFSDLLIKGQFKEAVKNFDRTMKKALPARKLRKAWNETTANAGPFEKKLGIRTEKYLWSDIIYVTCQFKEGPLDVKVVYDKNKKISGLWLVPVPQKVLDEHSESPESIEVSDPRLSENNDKALIRKTIADFWQAVEAGDSAQVENMVDSLVYIDRLDDRKTSLPDFFLEQTLTFKQNFNMELTKTENIILLSNSESLAFTKYYEGKGGSAGHTVACVHYLNKKSGQWQISGIDGHYKSADIDKLITKLRDWYDQYSYPKKFKAKQKLSKLYRYLRMYYFVHNKWPESIDELATINKFKTKQGFDLKSDDGSTKLYGGGHPKLDPNEYPDFKFIKHTDRFTIKGHPVIAYDINIYEKENHAQGKIQRGTNVLYFIKNSHDKFDITFVDINTLKQNGIDLDKSNESGTNGIQIALLPPNMFKVLDLPAGKVIDIPKVMEDETELRKYVERNCGSSVIFHHDRKQSYLAFINTLKIDEPTIIKNGYKIILIESKNVPQEITITTNDQKKYLLRIIKAENEGCQIQYQLIDKKQPNNDTKASSPLISLTNAKNFPYIARPVSENVSIRSGGGSAYYTCGKLKAGVDVTVVSEEFGWAKILPPKGSFSWIAKKYIDIDPLNPQKGILKADGVRVWVGSPALKALNSSTTQIKLSKRNSDAVELLGEEDDNYLKITPPSGAVLYVPAKQLKYIKPLAKAEPIKTPALLVLDSVTKQPVERCAFTFSGWGRVGETDKNGIYNDPGHNFAGELTSGGRGLNLWHPDYDSKGVKDYRPDKDGISRVYLSKGGNCRVDINVTLKVRGKMTEYPCRVIIMKPNRQEVRRVERSQDNKFNFSGLKAGKYLVEAYFWDSYPTVYKEIELAENEHKKMEINSTTDQVGRIQVIGKLLDKRTGKGIAGAKVHFVGAPSDDVTTSDNGSFSAMADRARFHQCLIYFDKRPPIPIRISNNIDEKLAKNLAIHFDPMNSNSKERMTDEDGDGIFCDELHCSICKQNTKTSLQD